MDKIFINELKRFDRISVFTNCRKLFNREFFKTDENFFKTQVFISSFLSSFTRKRRIFGIFFDVMVQALFIKRFLNFHFFSSIKMTTNPEITKRDKLKSSFNILVREEITKQNSQIEDLENCHEQLQVMGRP